jgi:hypothetical protein
MPKYLGKRRIGYCQRTGKKVLYEDLVQDGETGALVEKGWDDPVHPQRFLPDVGIDVRPTMPAPDNEAPDVIVPGPLWVE